MTQAKKKQSTKTTKSQTRAKTSAAKKRTCVKKTCCISNRERNHVYIVTVMSMIAALLLCANVAMMIA